MLMHLSIGEVSTLIAAAVFLAHFVLPNAFALIQVRVLNEQPNAATWGFLQRSLAGTDWPVFLRTDSIACRSIDTRLRILNWFQIALATLVALAAILTPAGLYDEVKVDKQPTQTSFVRAYDEGVFGPGTQIQNEIPWRTCQDYPPGNDSILIDVQCPGDTQQYTLTHNASGYYQVWDDSVHYVTVHKSRADIFQSGLSTLPHTVSSFFDIKPRRIRRSTGDYRSNYSGYLPTDGFQFLQSVIDTDSYQLVNGLVVDAKNGGIGFRNHTVPDSKLVPLGATWTEDLLFIESEVATVDLNLSYVWEIPFLGAAVVTDLPFSLIDDGGFANFDPERRPVYDPVSQGALNLQDRADTTAWWLRYWTMRAPVMNLSDPATGEPSPSRSKVGQIFATKNESYRGVTATHALKVGAAVDFLVSNTIGYNETEQNMYSNFSNAFARCTGWNKSDLLHIDGIPVQYNLMLGAATNMDGTGYDIVEEGMTLKRKLYVSAFALKVSIKTVEFVFNVTGSNPLNDLRVLSISEKQYKDDDSRPIWGIETPPLFQGNMQPLWGLVNRSFTNVTNITTIQASSFYPNFWPVGSSLSDTYQTDSYLTASFGLSAVYTAMADIYSSDDSSISGANDGHRSPILFRRWQSLSRDAPSASKILKLVFTNAAANYFTGSRGWLSESIIPPPYINETTNQPTSVIVPTYQSSRVVRYHIVYGIPAFLAALLLILLVLLATFAALTGSIAKLSGYLSLLSAGRLLIELVSGTGASYDEPYKTWARTRGQLRIRPSEREAGWRAMNMNSAEPWSGQGDGLQGHDEKEKYGARTGMEAASGAMTTTTEDVSSMSEVWSNVEVRHPFLAEGRRGYEGQ